MSPPPTSSRSRARHVPRDVEAAAREVLDRARAPGWQIATAESCTGGLVAGALTEIAGSSDVVDQGASSPIPTSPRRSSSGRRRGAPDRALRLRCRGRWPAPWPKGRWPTPKPRCTVAVTGIAGPTGGSPDKPVGLVAFRHRGERRRDAPSARDVRRPGTQRSAHGGGATGAGPVAGGANVSHPKIFSAHPRASGANSFLSLSGSDGRFPVCAITEIGGRSPSLKKTWVPACAGWAEKQD